MFGEGGDIKAEAILMPTPYLLIQMKEIIAFSPTPHVLIRVNIEVKWGPMGPMSMDYAGLIGIEDKIDEISVAIIFPLSANCFNSFY